LHDRNPLTVRLKDGGVRNGYTVRLANMRPQLRRFAVSISGVEGVATDVVGVMPNVQDQIVIDVGPDQTRETRLLLAAPEASGKTGQTPIAITMTDVESGASIEAKDVFVWP
jgi:polyferredoxin